MKELKDYIHLYLGCKCLIQQFGEHPKSFGVISCVEHGDSLVMIIDSGPNTRAIRITEIKLVLRPLSSMTDVEVRELIQYDKLCEEYKSLVYEFFPDGKRIEIQWSVETDDGIKIPNNWTLSLIEMNAHDFAWALKKGFDLFGLKEAGLAIYE